MEFANIQVIRAALSMRGGIPEIILPYKELKTLAPVAVDDGLGLVSDNANLMQFEQYWRAGFLLVPIRREMKSFFRKRQDFPKRVIMELTSTCNLHCVMCPRNALERPELHMSKDVALRCLDEINQQGVQGVWLFNIGEPAQHPDFEEIFSYCNNKPNLGSLWLSTNGQDFKPAIMDLVLGSTLTFLNYSLNAMSPETYRLVSPTGSYDRLVANLKLLLSKKASKGKAKRTPWIRIQMIEQPQVISEIDAFLMEYASKTEIVSINLLEAFSQNVAANNAFAKQRERQNGKYCKRIMRGDAFVFADGEVGFCGTDFNHTMSVGNIRESSLQEIWNGRKFQEYKMINESRQLDRLPLCSRCVDYDL